MEEIISYAVQNGYSDLPQTLNLNGKINRFGKKDKYWYIGSVLHTEKGDSFNTATFGDWKHQLDQITYKPNKKFSKADKASILAKMEEQKQGIEAEKVKRAMLAEQIAGKMWAKATNKIQDHSYIKIKKINTNIPHGVKILDDEILVPCRNIDGTMTGLQRIGPKGKRFVHGQRNISILHTIGNIKLSDNINLCEGFSTAASLYEATKTPTVISFVASNLVNVAKALSKKYPEKNIYVCGDDDFKNDINTGVQYAFEAAKHTRIEPIFPNFKDRTDGDTDFNDLHVKEGLRAVKQCFDEIPEKDSFDFIGYNGDTHYFYVDSIANIKEIKHFTENDLFMLAPLDYWELKFPKKSGFDMTEARSFLIGESKKRSIYNPNYNRGCGVWEDEDRIIFNNGSHIFMNGKKINRSSFDSIYRYVQTERRLQNKKVDPLTLDETKILLEISGNFNWIKPQSSYLLLGWIAMARLSGALPIRPHAWLTGPKGAGKTVIMEKFIKPLLGQKDGYLYIEGGSSEAGIRQNLIGSSIPVLFDEFENEGIKTEKENAKIIQLFRQTWSAGGAQIVKGTAGGSSMSFKPNFSGFVASISNSLQTAADKSRFSMLEIAAPNGKNDKWNETKKLLININEDFGERLFQRSLNNAENIINSFEIIQKVIADQTTGRIGDHIGMLMASYYSLISDTAIKEEEAHGLVFALDLNEEVEEQKSESDESNLIIDILTKTVTLNHTDGMHRTNTVGYFILDKERNADETSEYQRSLKDYSPFLNQIGIVLQNDFVWFANKHTELSKILGGSKYGSGKWAGFLKRIEGRELGRKRFSNGDRSRSVGIPIDFIKDLIQF